MTKIIPNKKKFKKAKWLSEEALQIVEKRAAKGKGARYRYIQLKAEFQRTTRSQKDFLNDQCKEIEENNRMEKTTDLQKTGDTKGTFHAKVSTIKNRNSQDLKEAEEIKKRWQEYTKELYKEYLHDPDNHDDTITNLEPDILECDIKCALGSITTIRDNGGDGIPIELFQILKDDAVKVLHSIFQQVWKTQQWPQDWKMSASFQPQRKAIPKNAQTTEQLHASYTLAK